jgi:glycosyltransferase involved in cell wall biosynthesis
MLHGSREDISPVLRSRASQEHGAGRPHARSTILVFAPVQPPGVACGVTAAVRTFVASSVSDRYDVGLVSTARPHRERGLAARLLFGLWLVGRTVLQTIRSRAALADIHAVSDRSFLSHAAIMFGVRFAGRPALLRIHGGDFQRVFERATGFQRALIRLILRSATRIVVLSEGWRSRVMSIEPRSKVEVIPNPIDCRPLEGLSARPPRHPRKVLFLANFCERKGHFDALAAIASLASRYPDLVLELAGEDRDAGTKVRLEHEAQRLGIQGNIRFLGTVSGAEKDRAIRDADILILPSHTENMPISVMEGMAAALPVVATAVGAVPEMIEDGKTGFVIEARNPAALAERLEQLLRDPQLARRIGAAAQRHARSTWDAELVAERAMAVYRQFCEARGPRAA